MEIIHVILGKANPARMNGVNRVVNDLASHQAAAGLSVAVWGITSDTTHNYPDRNYETRLFWKERFPFSLNIELVAALSAQLPGTIFHLHGGFIPQMYSISYLLNKMNFRFVFTPHGSYNTLAMQKSKVAKWAYGKLFESAMLTRASYLHVLGESEAAGATTWFSGAPVVNIPYGHDLIDSPSKPEIKDVSKPFIVGYCGRIDIFTKGLDALISGFRIFNAKHPLSQLWIIGDGPEMPKLRTMVREADIADSVLFIGARYGTEKDFFLKKCDVFAHPSRNEGLPSSVLEAAALGLPCLVTTATNIGNAVKQYDCGIVMEHTDAASISKGLNSMWEYIQSGNGNRLRENARKMVSLGYNWKSITGAYTSMYENALAQ